MLPIDDLYYPKDLLKHWSLSGVDVGVFRPIPGKYRPPGGLVSLWPHHRGRVRIHWTVQQEILDVFPSLPVIVRMGIQKIVRLIKSVSDRKWTGGGTEINQSRTVMESEIRGMESDLGCIQMPFLELQVIFFSVEPQGSCISLRTQNQSKMDLLLLPVIVVFLRSACHQGLIEMRQRTRDSRIQPIVTDPSRTVH